MKKVNVIILAALWLALTGLAWFSPAEDISESERRKLAQFPEVSLETVLGGKFMTDFEDYTLDQFPLRDTFRQMKALFHYNVLGQKDNNDIYVANGYAAKLEYPLNQGSVSNAVDKFNSIYEKYLQDSKVVMTVVPDKGLYLAEENGYPAMDYEALFEAVQTGMPWAEFADISGLLDIEDYYRTDTHWRQEQILDVAQRLCEALGVAAFEEWELAPETIERPFYGVYYGQAALPMEPEPMYVMTNDVLDRCTVYNHETGKTTSVYDMEKLEAQDLYDVYLSGAAALLTIENPAAATDKELIVFRDSFGSSIIPLLLKDYATVTVVDTRYIAADLLSNFVDFHGQDVLMLYSTLILNNSNSLK
ncbi:MAG: hypothetical protein IKJ99_08950 [Oscillospiraceae bacterium]|nr:hypothetical protein [Oscillospiraceae bacterium]